MDVARIVPYRMAEGCMSCEAVFSIKDCTAPRSRGSWIPDTTLSRYAPPLWNVICHGVPHQAGCCTSCRSLV